MPYIFSIFLVALTLSACDSGSPGAMLNDYQTRMSNVLETDLPPPQDSPTLLELPDKRDRINSTFDIRQGLWEVLDFRQCDMLPIISKRNSLLGKVMLPSQKMRYELRFFAAIKNCQALLATLPASEADDSVEAFKTRLDEIYQLKAANLPAEIWNGIYASGEISKQFKTNASPLPLSKTAKGSPRLNTQSALNKLAYLSSLPTSDTFELPDWLDNIEDEYAIFHHSDFGSQLLATLPLVTSSLNRVAAGIELRLKRKPFCYKGHQPQRATVLNNIFRKYYVQQVQPYMALLEQQGKPWFETHDAIMTRLPAPPLMKKYQQQVLSTNNPRSLWGRWVSARNRHTKAWQTILGQCNMMPSV